LENNSYGIIAILTEADSKNIWTDEVLIDRTNGNFKEVSSSPTLIDHDTRQPFRERVIKGSCTFIAK
jgi:hypothetical protein